MSSLATEADNADVGQRLSVVRTSLRLTQVEFAESLGISPRAYANYERGERELPPAVLRRLYKVHRVDPLWTLSGGDSSPMRAAIARIDSALLAKLIRMVEDTLQSAKKTLEAEKKARVIQLAYEYYAERGGMDKARVQELLQLAA